MLDLKRVKTFYGSIQALFGMSLHIEQGKVTTLIGRNGMGKTTTVNSIMGITPCRSGEITFLGNRIDHHAPYQVAQNGIGLVPEGRQIFPNLSVRENLLVGANHFSASKSPWTLNRVIDFFPALQDRLNNMGNQLSGGEQQMLTIGRALMLNPMLLILDEATEGLAPLIRREIWHCLDELKKSGMTILLIDKNIEELNQIADYHYIIEKGKVVWDGFPTTLKNNAELKQKYLGI
ncbi:MAG: ABC transporter ATP-binding protein [Gammaproteobacteria bacterium]|nr:ABC transporter ATP-binding protein [Gammaproteobacteria bacterium]